jgi:hypothetical protein
MFFFYIIGIAQLSGIFGVRLRYQRKFPVISSQQDQVIFLISKTSRPVLGTIQPSM